MRVQRALFCHLVHRGLKDGVLASSNQCKHCELVNNDISLDDFRRKREGYAPDWTNRMPNQVIR